jgi:FG-GAP-like repeat
MFRSPSLVVIFLAALEIAPLSSARIFLTARDYPSGEIPVAAVVQDFNNDGIADIASANETNKNVSVFLGTGDGTFGPANTFRVEAGAMEIASADLNSDGNADLVVTGGIASACVALGNGDGTFGSCSRIQLGNQPLGIAIGDFNGDGILDLAVAIFGPIKSSNGKVAILIGVGNGSFAAPVLYDLTHNGVRLVTTDLNHDGKLDLAVAVQHFSTEENGLAVLLGNGDGTFQPVVTSVAGDASDVAAGDFNRDGNTDLAIAGHFAHEVRIVLGNGDGTFQSAVTYSTNGNTETVSSADLSGDGILDLLVGGDHSAVLLGNGDGTFGPVLTYAIGERFARIGYFNRDRAPDIVAGGGVSEIGVAFGRGDGSFRAPISFPVGERVDGIDYGDFNNDGLTDMVIGRLDGGSNQLMLLLGTGDGRFVEGSSFGGITGNHVKTADFNHDGNLDVLAVTFDGGGFYTFLGNGDGSFRPGRFTTVPGLAFDLWPGVDDFNHDDIPDVAIADFSDDTLTIFLGIGNGNFQPPANYVAEGPQSPITADFNGDGNKDVIVSNTFDSTVGVYLGNGDGTFQSPLTIPSRNALYSAPGDFNRDGKPDFVLGGQGLKVFIGNGDGTFQPPQEIYSEYGPVSVADIDGDGRLDIAVSSNFFGGLAVLRGKGDGTFRPAILFPTGSAITSDIVLADLNGDGFPEATINNQSNSLNVLLNTTR